MNEVTTHHTAFYPITDGLYVPVCSCGFRGAPVRSAVAAIATANAHARALGGEPSPPEPMPVVQRYLIAWRERERATERVVREQSAMIANEYETRSAIAKAPERYVEAQLLTGEKFKLSIAPNGRDIMVLPL